MKRTFAFILAALAAAAVFAGLVHAVLVAAQVSEPAGTTVYGLTPRRLWAAAVAVLALVGVVIGGLALARPASPFGTDSGRLGAIVALMAGLIAVVNDGQVLAIANGGPGTGNGVVGGSGALVLGATPSRRMFATHVLADSGARSKSSFDRTMGASTIPSAKPISHAISHMAFRRSRVGSATTTQRSKSN